MQNTPADFHAGELARIALSIGAIKLNPEKPFTWASGYRMPVYNDNRLLLGNAGHRLLVAQGMQAIVARENIPADVIAGTATAGIPPATSLANLLQTPLIYVRPKPKEHGMQNRIEGILKNDQHVVVIEDLISTGGSALKAVQAIRHAGADVAHCLCIFNYGFAEAAEAFKKAHCRLHSLLTFAKLIDYAESQSIMPAEHIALLRDWHQNPFAWGKP